MNNKQNIDLTTILENLDYLKQQNKENQLLIKELKRSIPTQIELEELKRKMEQFKQFYINLNELLGEIKTIKKIVENNTNKQLILKPPTYKTWIYK